MSRAALNRVLGSRRLPVRTPFSRFFSRRARVYTDGRVKEHGKQSRSLRRVPLRARVIQAVEEHPFRIDVPLVYPGSRGHLDLHGWRRDEWYPALEAAGLVKRGAEAVAEV